MHLDFITRGVQHQVDLFKTFMQAQMFDWKRTNLATGKEEVSGVQGALRPIQLWEYVFPEESLGEVLAMLGIQDFDLPEKKYPPVKMAMLRKMLGCEKLPKIPDVKPNRYIEMRGVAIIPIGIKRDPRLDFPQFATPEAPKGYNQEGL